MSLFQFRASVKDLCKYIDICIDFSVSSPYTCKVVCDPLLLADLRSEIIHIYKQKNVKVDLVFRDFQHVTVFNTYKSEYNIEIFWKKLDNKNRF